MDVPLIRRRRDGGPRSTRVDRGSALERLSARVLRARVPTAGRTAVVLAVFALVTAVRLLLIERYAVALPYSDQWDADGWNWLRPWQLGGGFDWSMLFAAHNEHRVAVVRLASLAWFALNQHQWDNLVGATADALCVGIAVALAVRVVLREAFDGDALFAFAVVAAACLPNGFENTVVAFQLQTYALIALAVYGAWLVAAHAPDWKLPLACAAVLAGSVFSMASGLLTAAVMLFGLGLRMRAGTPWTKLAPTAVVCVVGLVAGWQLLVPVPAHSALHARTLGEWFAGASVLESWPLPPSWPLVVVLWAPLLAAAVCAWRGSLATTLDRCALILALWAALQAAVIGYGRARDLAAIASRYTDVLAIGVLANAYLAVRLAHAATGRQRLLRLAAPAWIALVAAAFAMRTALAFVALHDFGAARVNQENYVRRYVRGHDATKLLAAEPWNVPYPDRERLRTMLDDPTIRSMLPASVRPQVALTFKDGFEPRRHHDAFGFDPRYYGKLMEGAHRYDAAGGSMSYLRFEAAGEFDQSSVTVGFEAPGAAPVRQALRPSASPLRYEVVAPAPAFTLEVTTSDPAAAFAVSAPVEVGRLSHWVGALLGVSGWLCIMAAMFALGVVARLFARDSLGKR